MSILNVVFVGLILLMITSVVLNIRKKFTQAPNKSKEPNSTPTDAPLDISSERIELLRYRVNETTTFGILAMLLFVIGAVTIALLPSPEVIAVIIALVLLVSLFFMYKCFLLAMANPNTSAPMLLFFAIFLPLFGILLAANTYFDSRSLLATLSKNAPATF